MSGVRPSTWAAAWRSTPTRMPRVPQKPQMPHMGRYEEEALKIPASPDPAQLLQETLKVLLAPLAGLCVQRGLPFAQVEELFKQAFVAAAREARQEPAPSFEALATSITRHVHARSLLDELIRRDLVRLSDDGETVQVNVDRITPSDDMAQMYGFLASNAGDHLSAAVANVLHGDRRHFEQAIFSDSMSTRSLEKAAELVRQQWQVMLQNLVPALQQMINRDLADGTASDQRIRIGMYSFHEPNPGEPDEQAS